MNKELIEKEGTLYEIIVEVNPTLFANSNGSINQQVLGMYVHEHQGERVLQREGKFLIVKVVEEATVIEWEK